MMIPFIITGDTHNEYGRFLEIINVMGKYSAVKEKYICIAGDFGYLYRDTPEEHLVLDEMEQQDFVFVVIPGNHENYPAFQQYEIVDFHGARAHKIRNNVFYICRGEIFKIGNKSFFAMSGAYSIYWMILTQMNKEGVNGYEHNFSQDD